MTRPLLQALAIAVIALFSSSAMAQADVLPKQLEHVGVIEHLDQSIPLQTPFTDTENRSVTLGQFFGAAKPRVLVFAYHSCPQQCSMVLRAVSKGLSKLNWTLGKEYDLVVVSIDPKDADPAEGLLRSAAKRQLFINEYNRPGAQSGIHFLQGTEASIAAVTKAAGFEYELDRGQYNHPSVVMLTKQNGDLARYLYGLEFNPNDLRLGLIEASEGRSISTVEQFMIYCFTYDPKGAKYVLVAWRVMRIGGGLVGLVLASVLALLWRREWRRKSDSTLAEEAATAAPSTSA
jgi:protein SCO1